MNLHQKLTTTTICKQAPPPPASVVTTPTKLTTAPLARGSFVQGSRNGPVARRYASATMKGGSSVVQVILTRAARSGERRLVRGLGRGTMVAATCRAAELGSRSSPERGRPFARNLCDKGGSRNRSSRVRKGGKRTSHRPSAAAAASAKFPSFSGRRILKRTRLPERSALWPETCRRRI